MPFRREIDGELFNEYRAMVHKLGSDLTSVECRRPTPELRPGPRLTRRDGGIIDAQRNLGLLYGKGQGVTQDDVQAYAWLNAAAVQGDETAAKSRDYAASQLNAEQRKEAEAMAKEYVEKYVAPFKEINAKPH